MKKFVYVLTCLMLVCVIPCSSQKTMSLSTRTVVDGTVNTTPTRDIEELDDGIRVTYRFENIVLHDDPLYKAAKAVKIDGFWQNFTVGEPAVLSRWDTFVVPNKDAKVIVSDSTYIEFPLELSPARPILSNSGNECYTKDNVRPIVAYESVFPYSVVPAIRNDSYRRQQLLKVCVSPVQYDFTRKKVRVFTKIEYKVQYDTVTLRDAISRFSKEQMDGTSFLENISLNVPSRHNSGVRNMDTLPTGYVHSKYLIVSVPKYTDAVNRFAEWKKMIGFDVQVEMREVWDTTAVKQVVRDAYDADSIEYLLIFGGQTDVPAPIRDEVFSLSHHYHPTDLYYGCMSDGYTPDIFRGRILVNTEQEAVDVVEKLINYEKNPVTDASFYNTGLHCAYFQDKNEYDIFGQQISWHDQIEDRRFVLTSERIRNGMLGIIQNVNRVYCAEDSVYPKYWNDDDFGNGGEIPAELQRPTFTWDGNTSDITNYINQKTLYVLMRDHGFSFGWSKPFYTSLFGGINSLNNTNQLPVVFSICCLTGKFTHNGCFCEEFLKKGNGGCIAIYGATEESLTGPNDVLAEGMFDAIWPSLALQPRFGEISNASYSPTPSPTYRFGQILDRGLKMCDEAYLGTSSSLYSRYTSELFHCFGDPSMMINTEIPMPFSGATVIRQDDGEIHVDTGGLQAIISFYNRITGEVVSYRGYSVTYSGNYDTSVCISAHNMIPYIDEGVLNIQNQTLTNSGSYAFKTIKVGNHVTPTQANGDVIFQQGDYHLTGNHVELHPGTTILQGTTVNISNY